MKRQWRDALELVVLPGLAATLPWPLGFRLLKSLARWNWLYQDAVTPAVQVHSRWLATRDGPDSDRTLALSRFAYERRLVTLVDHTDLYLVMTRTRRWLDRHCDTDGPWPQPNATCIVSTFHWGAGMWSLKAFRARGWALHGLAAPLDGKQFEGRPVLHLYARWRTRQVERELGHRTHSPSGDMRPILKALRSGEQVISVADVPADAVQSSMPVQVLGHHIRLPNGLWRVAARQGVRVAVFTIGLDLVSGRRNLQWVAMPAGASPEALTSAVAQVLNERVQSQPGHWHFWQEWARFKPEPLTPPLHVSSSGANSTQIQPEGS